MFRWLRDNLGLIKDSSEISSLAEQVEKTDGVYFVPAFSGFFFSKPEIPLGKKDILKIY